MADFQTFGFDNEDIKSNIYEKYEAKKGQTDRCGIVFSDPKNPVIGLKAHYKERYFACKKSKCCEVLGPSKYRCGAVLIQYATERNGELKKPLEYVLKPWLFNEPVYLKLKAINSEYPLTTHDIKITGTNDSTYKTVDIMNCAQSIWTTKEDFKNMVLEQAKPIWESIKRTVASDLTVEEINELLGVGGVNPGSDPSSKLNLDDVLNNI